jgi:hypothetical protein
MSRLHLIIETTAFFTFAVAISSLTILGAMGVDPFTQHPPQVQQTSR